jgi:hypothetical protein
MCQPTTVHPDLNEEVVFVKECVDILRVLPALHESDPTPQRRMSVKTYTVAVNPSRTPEEGAHSPSWQKRLVIVIYRAFANQNRPILTVSCPVLTLDRPILVLRRKLYYVALC